MGGRLGHYDEGTMAHTTWWELNMSCSKRNHGQYFESRVCPRFREWTCEMSRHAALSCNAHCSESFQLFILGTWGKTKIVIFSEIDGNDTIIEGKLIQHPAAKVSKLAPRAAMGPDDARHYENSPPSSRASVTRGIKARGEREGGEGRSFGQMINSCLLSPKLPPKSGDINPH